MNTVSFYHHRIGRSAITFAIKIGPKPAGSLNERWIQYSYAVCSPKDQFCRSKGRMIALGRLTHPKHKHVSGFPVSEEDIGKTHKLVWSDFMEAVMKKDDWVHKITWLRKLAKLIHMAANVELGSPMADKIYDKIMKITHGYGYGSTEKSGITDGRGPNGFRLHQRAEVRQENSSGHPPQEAV